MEPTTPLTPIGTPPHPPEVTPPQPQGTRQQKILAVAGNKKTWILFVFLILLALAAGYYLLNHRQPTATPDKSEQIQDISTEELRNFSGSLLKPTTNQTISITPNAVFGNNVTVDKLLSAGAISTKNLNITGPVNLDSANVNANLFVAGGTTLQGAVEARSQLTVRGALAASNASFSGNLAVAGTLTAGSLSVGDLTTKNLTINGDATINGHIAFLGGAVKASRGSAAGSGSVRVDGNDATGTVVIDAGGAPSGNTMATVVFNRPYPGVPHITITPIGQNAGGIQWFANRASGFFTIESLTLPAPGQEYVFDYFVQR